MFENPALQVLHLNSSSTGKDCVFDFAPLLDSGSDFFDESEPDPDSYIDNMNSVRDEHYYWINLYLKPYNAMFWSQGIGQQNQNPFSSKTAFINYADPDLTKWDMSNEH